MIRWLHTKQKEGARVSCAFFFDQSMMLQFLAVLMFWAVAASISVAQTAAENERRVGIEALSENPTVEQLRRKQRSVEYLTARGIPVLESLPVIRAEAQSLRRSDRAVAERALALMIVAAKGETGDQDFIDAVIDLYEADGLFTPKEQAFIDNLDPSDQMRTDMTWRYEGVAVLLWAVGLIDELPPSDQIIDASVLGNLFRSLGPDGLYQQARLRPQAELLDMADLTYRMNWAAVNARVNKKPVPDGINPGIVYERHYALNWLYGYAELSWDDMRTDT